MADNLLSVDERVGTNFRVTSDNGGPLEMRVVPPGGGSDPIEVTRVLFVDSGVGGVGATGALNQPYATITEAIADAVASLATSVVIKIAPGTYAEEIIIPPSSLTAVSFDGWTSAGPAVENDSLPVLSGGIVVQASPAPPDSPTVLLSNLLFTSTISSASLTDLVVVLHNVRATGSIQGATLYLYSTVSDIAGIVGGSDDTFLFLDGYTWGRLVANATAVSNAAKEFFDHGCDVCPASLSVTGLAIGASQEVSFPHPVTRNDEYAIITKTNIPAVDYTLTFSHTETDAVHAIITNLSRVSTNFDDTVATLVFHGTMPTFAPP
jgi:hypothetical protein